MSDTTNFPQAVKDELEELNNFLEDNNNIIKHFPEFLKNKLTELYKGNVELAINELLNPNNFKKGGNTNNNFQEKNYFYSTESEIKSPNPIFYYSRNINVRSFEMINGLYKFLEKLNDDIKNLLEKEDYQIEKLLEVKDADFIKVFKERNKILGYLTRNNFNFLGENINYWLIKDELIRNVFEGVLRSKDKNAFPNRLYELAFNAISNDIMWGYDFENYTQINKTNLFNTLYEAFKTKNRQAIIEQFDSGKYKNNQIFNFKLEDLIQDDNLFQLFKESFENKFINSSKTKINNYINTAKNGTNKEERKKLSDKLHKIEEYLGNKQSQEENSIDDNLAQNDLPLLKMFKLDSTLKSYFLSNMKTLPIIKEEDVQKPSTANDLPQTQDDNNKASSEIENISKQNPESSNQIPDKEIVPEDGVDTDEET